MTYSIKIKTIVGNTEIIIETTSDNKEEVSKELKELHELIKELFPPSNITNTVNVGAGFGANRFKD